MVLSNLLLSLALLVPGPGEEARLETLSAEVRSSDYRGQREDLQRLAGSLGAIRSPRLRASALYWQGFAHWRRAINGFNETPRPDDLRRDAEAAVASFRAALQERPGWIEAQAGLCGAAMNLLGLAADEPAWKQRLLDEFLPLWKRTTLEGADNPRVLWLQGGSQTWAASTAGGDPGLAAATLRRGLEAARREALASGQATRLEPAWGAAENLMSLAYLHAALTRDRALARAYAEGALAVVPEWHYVRDILLPQIDALPGPNR